MKLNVGYFCKIFSEREFHENRLSGRRAFYLKA